KSLRDLVSVFKDPRVDVASLKTKISSEEAENPNAVKVVTDLWGDALYFSRSKLPYNRESVQEVTYWKHIGVYAYRKNVLHDYTSLPKSQLEAIEMLEQLRLLENGYRIRMVETVHQAIAIDTIEDLEKAREYLHNKK
ncbi:MAG: 3-deoxy-manno-octulosonate cytidylyltransferase, partial [Algoriphagus sp.]